MPSKDRANAYLQVALDRLEAQQHELIQANASLERLATVDDLTGLKTRSIFHNSLVEMVAVSFRQASHLSLLMIDVDHFKRVNDTWGHQKGDRVLTRIGHALHANTRDQDIVARYSGEEFAVLLPNTGARATMAVAETLRECCRTPTEAAVQVSVSVGVATLAAGDTDQSLHARADEALYAAKRAGRDRVAHGGPST